MSLDGRYRGNEKQILWQNHLHFMTDPDCRKIPVKTYATILLER